MKQIWDFYLKSELWNAIAAILQKKHNYITAECKNTKWIIWLHVSSNIQETVQWQALLNTGMELKIA
jgi:hypothetical protein